LDFIAGSYFDTMATTNNFEDSTIALNRSLEGSCSWANYLDYFQVVHTSYFGMPSTSFAITVGFVEASFTNIASFARADSINQDVDPSFDTHAVPFDIYHCLGNSAGWYFARKSALAE